MLAPLVLAIITVGVGLHVMFYRTAPWRRSRKKMPWSESLLLGLAIIFIAWLFVATVGMWMYSPGK